MPAHYYDGPIINEGTVQNVVAGWTGTASYPFPFRDRSTYAYTIGVNTPKYWSLKKSGALLPHTPFRKLDYLGTANGSFFGTYDVFETVAAGGAQINHWTSSLPMYTEFDCSFNEGWVDGVLARVPEPRGSLLQQVAGKISSNGFDALTFLAESGKLQSQFTGLVQRLRKLVTSKRVIVNAAGAWLEGRYAWRTLWFDMLNFQEALELQKQEFRSRVTERSGYDQTISGTTLGDRTSYLYGSFTAVPVTSWTLTVGHRATISADLKAKLPAFRFDLVQTGWELVNLSFVVDWFLSVGGALEALSFLSVSHGYVASTGQNVVYEEQTELSDIIYPADTETHKSSVSVSSQCQKVLTLRTRMPASIPLIPQPQLRLDRYKILDLVALVVQQTKRR